jgi:antitoxin VapB
MGAQLNIKSEDAYRLASRLSELTGESLTTVVTRALRAELEREERQRDVKARVDRVMEIAREIRAHMREPVSSDTSWLYDDENLRAFGSCSCRAGWAASCRDHRISIEAADGRTNLV